MCGVRKWCRDLGEKIKITYSGKCERYRGVFKNLIFLIILYEHPLMESLLYILYSFISLFHHFVFITKKIQSMLQQLTKEAPHKMPSLKF